MKKNLPLVNAGSPSPPGSPFPLGATKKPGGWNFAIYSRVSLKELLLAHYAENAPVQAVQLDAAKNKTGSVWHIFVQTEEETLLYAYKTASGQILSDPYAKLLNTHNVFGAAFAKNPFGIAFEERDFDWEGDAPPRIAKERLVLYEVHLRGFTRHSSSQVTAPGTYLGAIEKIPYLQQLGVNAVEFLPLTEFDETDAPKTLCNFWGYSPLSFFAPMQRYAHSANPIDGMREFKTMVKAFHKAGIEVIVDVVFNHTGEGSEYGRTFSWKGFAEKEYYLKDTKGHFLNFSGCGNTFNCNNAVASDMIIEALRHWVAEFHVDGFRFDLASILTRSLDGSKTSSALVDRITQDPLLAQTKLIAEAWDAAGAHQVGSFYLLSPPGHNTWSEWNDDYRTVVRSFIKGTPGYAGRFATKLCGSEDLYSFGGTPLSSINYVTCHDGFTLKDLVSYQQKHNEENKEDNRDGSNANDSWNSGHEGPTRDARIRALRERQMKNCLLALFISAGIPMLLSGDEYGHTKNGNNNTWCLDNEKNWFLWDEMAKGSDLVDFCRRLIAFRQTCPLLHRTHFYRLDEIEWHGLRPHVPDWSYHSQFVALSIKDPREHHDLYVAFNACPTACKVTLPKTGKRHWDLVISSDSSTGSKKQLPLSEITLPPYSSCLMQATN